MTVAKAIQRAHILYRKHISTTSTLDLRELQEVIRRETRKAEQGIIAVSRGLLREMRAERREVAVICRVLREDV